MRYLSDSAAYYFLILTVQTTYKPCSSGRLTPIHKPSFKGSRTEHLARIDPGVELLATHVTQRQRCFA